MTELLYSPDGTAAILTAVLLTLTAGGIVAVLNAWDTRHRTGGRHRDGGLWFYPRNDDGTLGEPRRMIADPKPFWWRPPGFKTLAGSSAGWLGEGGPRTLAGDGVARDGAAPAWPALPSIPMDGQRGPDADVWPAPGAWEPGQFALAPVLDRALVGRDEEAAA